MNHQFMKLSDAYLENSFITSDSYLRHAEICEKCIYHRSDAIFRKRIWRGNIHNSLLDRNLHDEDKNLILGHSDQKTKVATIRFLRTMGYKRIFGINVDRYQEISLPVPIGLTNNTNESEYHRLFGNNDLFSIANGVDFLTESNGLIYGCFSTSTNKKERGPLAKILSNARHTFEEPTFSIEGRILYLENLRRHAFTVCPVGNGIDTHRLWEVLYMGGIPIIKENRILQSLLEGLPFVLVKKWEQIEDHLFLEEAWERLAKGTFYDFEKLKFNYWINLIHSR
jgi:hypothetical protein